MHGSPLDYQPDPDTLYRNNGDGTFTDISDASGIGQHRAYGMGLVCTDYDLDGDTDILVGNDTGANYRSRQQNAKVVRIRHAATRRLAAPALVTAARSGPGRARPVDARLGTCLVHSVE